MCIVKTYYFNSYILNCLQALSFAGMVAFGILAVIMIATIATKRGGS